MLPHWRIASGRPWTFALFKANTVWAYDFDTTVEGQQIKCLTVIDELTCECLAMDAAGIYQIQVGGRGVVQAGQLARRATVDALGQRPGVCQSRRLGVGSPRPALPLR
jgi:hypothetical protein